MAKRRHAKNEELLLIPFLDILCSLIGVLVLIIVVLCVAQSQKAKGRTQEELDRSQLYVDSLKKQKEVDKNKSVLQIEVAKLEELRKQVEEKEVKLARLRKLLASSADIQKMNAELSQTLLKELDDMLVEMDGLTKQGAESKKEIALLMEEIKKRQIPTDKKTPPVIVQPGGSGLAKDAKVFFVEATGGKLTLYWSATQKTVLSATDEVIATDVAFQHFLREVSAAPKSKIIFLLRDDGMGAYNKAAGWAQATYGYRVDQIGKLPIPGRGEVDLQMFKEFLGSMPPPPEAKLVTPPATPAPKV
jgi:TolA-binding protein